MYTSTLEWDTMHRTLAKYAVKCGDLGGIHFLCAGDSCNYPVHYEESPLINAFRIEPTVKEQQQHHQGLYIQQQGHMKPKDLRHYHDC